MPYNERKIVVIGPNNAGKSAFTVQYDSYRKLSDVDKQEYLLEILDTAEPSDYSELRELYYKNADGIIAIFSLTSTSSLADMILHIDFFLGSRQTFKIPLVIVGSKCDLIAERQVSYSDAETVAKRYDAQYFESSSKTRINNLESMAELIRETNRSLQQSWWDNCSTCRHLFLGNKHSLSLELAYKVANVPFQPLENRPIQYISDMNDHAIAGSIYGNNNNFWYWGVPCKSFDVVYFCFSLINRTSFKETIKTIKEIETNHMVKVLVGTQLDIRDWYSTEKEKVVKKVTTQCHSGVDLVAMLPEEIVLHILRYLPVLGPISCTCKRLDRLSKHDSLWGLKKIDGPFISYEEGNKAAKQMQCVTYIEVGTTPNISIESIYNEYVISKRQEMISKMNFKDKKEKKKKKKFFFF